LEPSLPASTIRVGFTFSQTATFSSGDTQSMGPGEKVAALRAGRSIIIGPRTSSRTVTGRVFQCPEVWSKDSVREALVETLGFLSDDEFSFDFRQATTSTGLQPYLDFSDPLRGSAVARRALCPRR
jgi:hypothetical protein